MPTSSNNSLGTPWKKYVLAAILDKFTLWVLNLPKKKFSLPISLIIFIPSKPSCINWIFFWIFDCLWIPHLFNFSLNKKRYKDEKNKKNIDIRIVKYKFIYASKQNIPNATTISSADFKIETK